MENEMMNNMDAMTENLTDATPEVDNLVPSVDENHAEMSSASGSFGSIYAGWCRSLQGC